MTVIDEGTPLGRRVRARLMDERVIWLTTTRSDGTPQPSPVWFLPDGDDAVILFSEPDAPKVKAIRANPRVALNFNATADGGDVQVINGLADAPDESPRAEANEAYIAKYASGLASLSMSPAAFSDQYAQLIRVHFRTLRGF